MIYENERHIPKLLIVDDSKSSRMAIMAGVKNLEITCIEADGGNDALSKIIRHQFFAIILDVELPEIDGFHLADLIRQQDEHKMTPIIFVTGVSQHQTMPEMMKAYKTGAVDYLYKPVDRVVLQSKVNILLQQFTHTQKLETLLEKVENANAELKQANAMKNEFTSMVTHELRTPISIMEGAIHNIKDGIYGRVTKSQTEILDTILSNTTRLNELVTEILDVSKMEAGKMKLVLKPTDIRTVIKDVMASHKPKAIRENIHLTSRCQKNVPKINLDANKITQVFTNLLNNSFKYTSEGDKISISARTIQNSATREEFIEIQVKDTGVGIPKGRVSQIFAKYTQVRDSQKVYKKGTGLGLAICKGIVTAHGGDIRVESVPNKETVFTFTLPLKPKSNEVSILLVDDSKELVKAIESVLRKKVDCKIYTISDSYDAFLKVGILKPDIMVVDVLMPKLDGFDLYDHIQEIPEIKDTEFVFMTGLIDHEIDEKLKERQIEHCFQKPVGDDFFDYIVSRIKEKKAAASKGGSTFG